MMLMTITAMAMVQYGNSVLSGIERMVCGCVNNEMDVFRPGSAVADPNNLYGDGKVCIPLRKREAKRFCLWVMKDLYGMSNSQVAKRCGMGVDSVRRTLRGVRFDIAHDAIAFAIYKSIMAALNGDGDVSNEA